MSNPHALRSRTAAGVVATGRSRSFLQSQGQQRRLPGARRLHRRSPVTASCSRRPPRSVETSLARRPPAPFRHSNFQSMSERQIDFQDRIRGGGLSNRSTRALLTTHPPTHIPIDPTQEARRGLGRRGGSRPPEARWGGRREEESVRRARQSGAAVVGQGQQHAHRYVWGMGSLEPRASSKKAPFQRNVLASPKGVHFGACPRAPPTPPHPQPPIDPQSTTGCLLLSIGGLGSISAPQNQSAQYSPSTERLNEGRNVARPSCFRMHHKEPPHPTHSPTPRRPSPASPHLCVALAQSGSSCARGLGGGGQPRAAPARQRAAIQDLTGTHGCMHD